MIWGRGGGRPRRPRSVGLGRWKGGKALERTCTPSNAARLRHNHLVACAQQPGAEVVEIFDSTTSRRNENEGVTAAVDGDLERRGTNLHRFPLFQRGLRQQLVCEKKCDEDDASGCDATLDEGPSARFKYTGRYDRRCIKSKGCSMRGRSRCPYALCGRGTTRGPTTALI